MTNEQRLHVVIYIKEDLVYLRDELKMNQTRKTLIDEEHLTPIRNKPSVCVMMFSTSSIEISRRNTFKEKHKFHKKRC